MNGALQLLLLKNLKRTELANEVADQFIPAAFKVLDGSIQETVELRVREIIDFGQALLAGQADLEHVPRSMKSM